MTLEQIQALTDDEIRVRVAELQGWERDDVSDCWRKDGHCYFIEDPLHLRQLPNYPADLNACASFEATLAEWGESTMRSPYRDYLYQLQKIMPRLSRVPCAPARQRCEAFLATMGKDTP